MANAKIRPRRGTVTQWATVNPILAEGEIGIEFPNTGVGTGKVKIKFGDGSTRWNSLPYAVGADDTTIRYVNDENDENHTWIQVKDNDGTWKNWKQTYLGRYDLYVAGENAGQFTTFAGTWNLYTSAIKAPTVTFNPTLDVTLSSATTGAYTRGCVIMANPIDLSDFSVLRFTFSGSTSSNATGSTAGTSSETGASVFITANKEERMTPVVSQDFFKANISNKPLNEECILDISSLSGEYYIVFLMRAYDHSTVNLSIDNLYLE